jgi:hypothetical protein
MILKSITIDNEDNITIHTDEGLKKILPTHPMYTSYRTQLETISFQAYQFDSKVKKYHKPHGDKYFNDEWNPKE